MACYIICFPWSILRAVRLQDTAQPWFICLCFLWSVWVEMPIVSACPDGRRCWGSTESSLGCPDDHWDRAAARQGVKCWSLLTLQVKTSWHKHIAQTVWSIQHLGISFQEYQLFCSRACKEGGPVSSTLVLVVFSRWWICRFRYALCGCAAVKQEFRQGKDIEILTALRITGEVPVWSKCCLFCLCIIHTSVIWG